MAVAFNGYGQVQLREALDHLYGRRLLVSHECPNDPLTGDDPEPTCPR